MRAFVTGINGFAGSFLAEALIRQGFTVGGTVFAGTSTENISQIINDLQLFELDLTKKNGLSSAFSSFDPEIVFHLAGESSVKASFSDPYKSFNVNVIGSLNVLEEVRTRIPKAKVLLISSGDIYGESLLLDNLSDEETKAIPISPYGVSKAAVDMLGRVYARSFNLEIVVARPFSHIGPRQPAVFFIPTVARQIAEIKKGRGGRSLKLGDLGILRDFTDVRDIVRAYILLAERGRRGEAYNICSGKQYLLRKLVEKMITLSNEKIDIDIDLEKIRNSDLNRMRPDNRKLINETGWQPEIDIGQTLYDVLDYWAGVVN